MKFDSNLLLLSMCVLVFVNINVVKADSSIFLGTKVTRRDGSVSNHFLLLDIKVRQGFLFDKWGK